MGNTLQHCQTTHHYIVHDATTPCGHWIRGSPYSTSMPELEGMETSRYIRSLFNCFTCGSNRDVTCNKWCVNGLLRGRATECGVTATRRFNDGHMIIHFTAKSVTTDPMSRRNAKKTCLQIVDYKSTAFTLHIHTQTRQLEKKTPKNTDGCCG